MLRSDGCARWDVAKYDVEHGEACRDGAHRFSSGPCETSMRGSAYPITLVYSVSRRMRSYGMKSKSETTTYSTCRPISLTNERHGEARRLPQGQRRGIHHLAAALCSYCNSTGICAFHGSARLLRVHCHLGCPPHPVGGVARSKCCDACYDRGRTLRLK